MLGELYNPHGLALEQAQAVLEVENPHAVNVGLGCTGGCSYCLSPNTKILMADLTIKFIKDLDINDEVIGVHRDNNLTTMSHKYTKARVLNKFAIMETPYKITLESGINIICSGNHRWLTNRGWKYTIGAMQGLDRRPYLTTNNQIRGIGRLFTQHPISISYKKGYLSGMICGDGTIGVWNDKRSPKSKIYMFRLALKDIEGMLRVAHYLSQFGIEVQHFDFNMGSCSVPAIRTSSIDNYTKIKKLIKLPLTPSKEWYRGFMAGFFDAEGSYNNSSVIRVFNTCDNLLRKFEEGLIAYNFRMCYDKPKPDGCQIIRLLGGISEIIRFFILVNSSIGRKRNIMGIAVKNRFKVKTIYKMSDKKVKMYDITTTTGNFIANGLISHNCYGPTAFHKKDWERVQCPKIPPAQLVKKQLHRGLKPQGIFISFGTDPFIEKNIMNSYQLLRLLKDRKIPVAVSTKQVMPVRITPRKLDDFRHGKTIVSIDREFRKKHERNSAPIPKRIADLHKDKVRGIYVWDSMEPYPVPKIYKQDIIKVLEAIKFMDFIIFGKWNYDERANDKEAREFYAEVIPQFVDWCKSNKIRYHVKSDTLKFAGLDPTWTLSNPFE